MAKKLKFEVTLTDAIEAVRNATSEEWFDSKLERVAKKLLNALETTEYLQEALTEKLDELASELVDEIESA